VQEGLDANTRATALFLTNKENMVAATGHFEGTALNSDRQLWSVAATLAGTLRMLVGIRLEPTRLAFRPMVPPSYGGERSLRGLRYRDATLDIIVRGHGNDVRETRLDGVVIARAEIPENLTGTHTIEITMNGRWPAGAVNMVPNRFAPATPRAEFRGGALSWAAIPGAVRYVVYRNGTPFTRTAGTRATVRPAAALDEYQLLAVNAVGDESFLSEPVRVVNPEAELEAKPVGVALEREHAGFTGAGYVTLSRERNVTVNIPVRIEQAGRYVVDVRYANGNGPVNTEDKVAVRTLIVDGDTLGVIVMPQRGPNRWGEWGWSNGLQVRLSPGEHTLTLAYTPLDENMNRRQNTALLDHVRVTLLQRLP
jgi:hypothetical protein